jgi:hypothetical protein
MRPSPGPKHAEASMNLFYFIWCYQDLHTWVRSTPFRNKAYLLSDTLGRGFEAAGCKIGTIVWALGKRHCRVSPIPLSPSSHSIRCSRDAGFCCVSITHLSTSRTRLSCSLDSSATLLGMPRAKAAGVELCIGLYAKVRIRFPSVGKACAMVLLSSKAVCCALLCGRLAFTTRH